MSWEVPMVIKTRVGDLLPACAAVPGCSVLGRGALHARVLQTPEPPGL